MMVLITNFITTFVYQPFFNLLVYIYLLIDKATGGGGDMGWAVIIFTLVFRLLILPLSLSGERGEKERREIAEKATRLENYYRDDPVRRKEERRKLLKTNRKILTSEMLDLTVQVLIALMLYRIFTTGLEGTDLHLLYSFMPRVTEPFNLVFLGRYDLAHPNTFINLVNTVVIFLAEFLSLRASPFPLTREDKAMLVVLPLGAFSFFAFMPAGKKLFVITTLSFSIGLILARQALYVYYGWAGTRVRSLGEKV